jgi:uncharacterized protein (DUF302 family)
MQTQTLQIRRLSIVSAKPFEEVLGRLTSSIGRPDMNALRGALARTKSLSELAEVVHGALGSSQLMEFVRFDLGRVLAAERGGSGPKLLRLIVGNPIIMKELVKATPEAASYAPVTILVDERADGVHLSYDSMASFLAPYGSAAALAVAKALDAKVENLLKEAAL